MTVAFSIFTSRCNFQSLVETSQERPESAPPVRLNVHEKQSLRSFEKFWGFFQENSIKGFSRICDCKKLLFHLFLEYTKSLLLFVKNTVKKIFETIHYNSRAF